MAPLLHGRGIPPEDASPELPERPAGELLPVVIHLRRQGHDPGQGDRAQLLCQIAADGRPQGGVLQTAQRAAHDPGYGSHPDPVQLAALIDGPHQGAVFVVEEVLRAGVARAVPDTELSAGGVFRRCGVGYPRRAVGGLVPADHCPLLHGEDGVFVVKEHRAGAAVHRRDGGIQGVIEGSVFPAVVGGAGHGADLVVVPRWDRACQHGQYKAERHDTSPHDPISLSFSRWSVSPRGPFQCRRALPQPEADHFHGREHISASCSLSPFRGAPPLWAGRGAFRKTSHFTVEMGRNQSYVPPASAQPLQAPQVLLPGGQQADSGGVHAGVTQQVGQLHHVPLGPVEGAGEQVPQVVGKGLPRRGAYQRSYPLPRQLSLCRTAEAGWGPSRGSGDVASTEQNTRQEAAISCLMFLLMAAGELFFAPLFTSKYHKNLLLAVYGNTDNAPSSPETHTWDLCSGYPSSFQGSRIHAHIAL